MLGWPCSRQACWLLILFMGYQIYMGHYLQAPWDAGRGLLKRSSKGLPMPMRTRGYRVDRGDQTPALGSNSSSITVRLRDLCLSSLGIRGGHSQYPLHKVLVKIEMSYIMSGIGEYRDNCRARVMFYIMRCSTVGRDSCTTL